MTRERALELRRIIELAIVSLDDTTALIAPELFPYWAINTNYNIGDRCRDRSTKKLYKCVQAHTSQSDWNPAATPALWVQVAEPGDEWPEWIQPTGAHDAYMKDDKVNHNEQHWISLIDNNVWEPGGVGTEALWSKQE